MADRRFGITISASPPLAIVDQNPKADSKVKEGRTTYLTLNATSAPTTEIPDLGGPQLA